MTDMAAEVLERPPIALSALLEPPVPAVGQAGACPSTPRKLCLGGAHDLLYALLAADVGLRPALDSMDIWHGLVAAEPQLKVISPKQIHQVAKVHLDDGRMAPVDGVEDSLTFLELYRGIRRYLGFNIQPNRHDIDDLMTSWLCPFIGRKIEGADKVAQALRGHLWEKVALSPNPQAEWDRLARRLAGRFQMSQGYLAGFR